MSNFLSNLDLNKNEIQNIVVHKAASAPSNPKTGQIYFNTTDNKIYRYNGTAWVADQSLITANGILQGDGAGNISTVTSTSTSTVNTVTATTLSIDGTPTQSSTNLITSGGVYAAIAGIDGLPSVSSSDNGKILMVSSGAWTVASLPVYDGTVV